METLIKLTTDVWEFGCKGDVIKVTEDRLKQLEAKASQMGKEVYAKLEEAAAAVEGDAKAVETKVEEAVKGQSKAADAKAAEGKK